MLLGLSHEECQWLADVLTRRLAEIEDEEHRCETWHCKDLLRQEHAGLAGLRDRIQRLLQAEATPAAFAE
jgi:hypothetical protein